MSSLTRLLAAGLLAVLPIVSGLGQQPAVPPVAAGDTMPSWAPGTLDIHHIVTGRGNAAFLQFPDGTTMLVDAGDAGAIADLEARPNAQRSAGQWIARYIQRRLGGRDIRLDYLVITHYHADHLGRVTGSERRAGGGYFLSGVTEVAELVPVRTLIDRGDDYQPPPAQDAAFTNYRRFAQWAAQNGTTRRVTATAGAVDQIVPVADLAAMPAPFEARIISVNDRVWTGRGNASKLRFPPVASIEPAGDRPTENMCSVTLRVKYGRFDYFTGGDQPGYPNPGAPEWHDLESEVARAIGPTDVHVVSHHGSIEAANPFWLSTLASRVMVVPAWAATHPSPDVLKRMLATRVYAKPRDIFVTWLREPTKATIGPRAAQVASDHGHIVVRVEPGGERYWVFVLDDTDESSRVRLVKGPYSAD